MTHSLIRPSLADVVLRPFAQLRAALARIDGRGYKAYRDLRGGYVDGGLELHVDHVQGDPFAAPSRMRLRLDQREAGLPGSLFAGRIRRIALEDLLARRARHSIAAHARGSRGSGRSGEVSCDAGGQEVLERTAAVVNERFVELRVTAGLPAAGRRVLAREAETLLCDELPRIAEDALILAEDDLVQARRFVTCIENQEHVRSELAGRGLLAFVADGSRLPRRSGVDDRPLETDAVPFRSPESLRVRFELPNPAGGAFGEACVIDGMGIREGVTLIVGGGYHGKSTLLSAVEHGIHPHVPGDGREYIVARPDLVKIRAEDGRRVSGVDIRAFIGTLPGGRSTRNFSSDDASGSTSQAASLVEALEIGTSGLLLDEDTCATNFMLRDAKMQALVPDEAEPITPFRERVRELYEALGVSTLLVMGGVGDYFSEADTVLRMTDYRATDVSAEAKKIAGERAPIAAGNERAPLAAPPARRPEAKRIDPTRGRGREPTKGDGRARSKIDVRAIDTLVFGRHELDLRALEQLVDRSQTRAIGHALARLGEVHLRDAGDGGEAATLRDAIAALEAELDEHGLGILTGKSDGTHPGALARPRAQEIAAALNRLRS